MYILITGAAGFIGYHLSSNLIQNKKFNIIGLDNINDYYDTNLKLERLNRLGIKNQNLNKLQKSKTHSNFNFQKLDLKDKFKLTKIFQRFKIDVIINLAAQAGVRYSLENPQAYINNNITGFLNLLETAKEFEISKILYASTSSVYGNSNSNNSENNESDKPISFYAATKKSNELMAHCYSNLFNIKLIGLRFFTVYGPWGRPDMALFKFVKNIIENKKIKLYNNGDHMRDFTYVDDIIDGIVIILNNIDNIKNNYEIFNLARGHSVPLIRFVESIEKKLNKKAIKTNLPMQLGDVHSTSGNINKMEILFGYKPKVDVDEGISKFIDWFIKYYK